MEDEALSPVDYKALLKQSSVSLRIPIYRCQEAFELAIEKVMDPTTNPYLRVMYTVRAYKLIQSMKTELPMIETYFRHQGNPVVLAMLDESLDPYTPIG